MSIWRIGCLGINHNYNFIWLTHIYESKVIAMLSVFILNVNTFNHNKTFLKKISLLAFKELYMEFDIMLRNWRNQNLNKFMHEEKL